MDKNLCPETTDAEKPFKMEKPSIENEVKTIKMLEPAVSEDGVATRVPQLSSSLVLSCKHDPDYWANNEHVKRVPNPKARPFIEADMAVAQQIWTEHFKRIKFSIGLRDPEPSTAGWTDPEGNDWEFDHDGNHNLIAARVMYEDDGMEGGDLDIDLLDQLSEAEQAEADALWAQVQWGADQSAGTMTLEGASGKNYLVTHDGKGNVLHARRATGRPSANLEEQPAIAQSQLYRDTLATGHQDAEAQVVRNEIGLAIQILRNLLITLRSDVTEVSAAAEGNVSTGDILNLYFHELLEYKGQLDSGKDTTEDQDRRAFFIMAIVAFFKTQYDFRQNPTQNPLPSHMRQLRRRR